MLGQCWITVYDGGPALGQCLVFPGDILFGLCSDTDQRQPPFPSEQEPRTLTQCCV